MPQSNPPQQSAAQIARAKKNAKLVKQYGGTPATARIARDEHVSARDALLRKYHAATPSLARANRVKELDHRTYVIKKWGGGTSTYAQAKYNRAVHITQTAWRQIGVGNVKNKIDSAVNSAVQPYISSLAGDTQPQADFGSAGGLSSDASGGTGELGSSESGGGSGILGSIPPIVLYGVAGLAIWMFIKHKKR